MNEETQQVMFSSKNQGCVTPKAFFEFLNDEFHFTTDVGATHENALKADYLGLDNGRDALKNPWGGVDYCNPPYGREVGLWTKKAWEESQTYGRDGDSIHPKVVVMLLPGRIDTQWFKDWVYGKASEVRIVIGRLKFDIGPHNHKKTATKPAITGCTERHPAPFPSIVVIYDQRTAHHGTRFSLIEKPEGVDW